jgi:hypothetical protein
VGTKTPVPPSAKLACWLVGSLVGCGWGGDVVIVCRAVGKEPAVRRGAWRAGATCSLYSLLSFGQTDAACLFRTFHSTGSITPRQFTGCTLPCTAHTGICGES